MERKYVVFEAELLIYSASTAHAENPARLPSSTATAAVGTCTPGDHSRTPSGFHWEPLYLQLQPFSLLALQPDAEHLAAV